MIQYERIGISEELILIKQIIRMHDLSLLVFQRYWF